MRHSFTYNGTNLRTLGFFIATPPKYQIAKRSFDFASVYGKNGGVISDNGVFDNVEMQFEVNSYPYIVPNESNAELVRAFAEWLTVWDGEYKIFRDTSNPGYYTKAICTGVEPIEEVAPLCLSTTINFSRVPFWYSDLGQEIIRPKLTSTQNAEIKIYNPENYTSEPLIKIINKGAKVNPLTLTVNDGQTLTVKTSSDKDYIELDSEQQSASFDNGTSLANNCISCTEFPKLLPGWNKIKLSGKNANTFTDIEIKPNWRRL